MKMIKLWSLFLMFSLLLMGFETPTAKAASPTPYGVTGGILE
ncbi:hypothetical protein P4S95_22640 [Aneurinibacillus aneurinilyticus]|nr:hypothetical protein [Aneurinibacillus aneurinilyticus]